MKRSNAMSLLSIGALSLCGALTIVSCADGAPVDETDGALSGPLARNCGTQDHSQAHQAEIQRKLESLRALNRYNTASLTGPITIDVYFHVVTNGSTGQLSDAEIQGQIDFLNESYGGDDAFFWDNRTVSDSALDVPFRFDLKGITRTAGFLSGPLQTGGRNGWRGWTGRVCKLCVRAAGSEMPRPV
jgi:hypothetical protein